MVDYLIKEDGGFILQQDGVSRIILDATGSGTVLGPTGLNAQLLTIPNHMPALVGPSHISTIPYAYLTWTPSANGSSFDHYEIQRFDPDGSHPIAYILNESANHFADFELHHGRNTSWIIRSVLRTGDASPFVAFGTLNVTITDDCAVYLVSNQNPDKSLALHHQPNITYTDSNADDVAFIDIEGRDTPMGFVSSEQGGDVFQMTFTLAFNDTAVTAGTVRGGRNIPTALLSLLRDATLPSITLLDGHTDRWYTTPKIVNWTEIQPGDIYRMTVEFHETAPANAPPIVTTTTPWSHP